MSICHDSSVAELETLVHKVYGECDAARAATGTSFAKCDKEFQKIEPLLHDQRELIHKSEHALAEHKVSIVAPHILTAHEKLPNVELKLKVAEFEQQRKIDECKRLHAKHLDASKKEIRFMKENKQLTKKVETLTAQREGEATPQEQTPHKENKELKKQLALLQAQLESKTEECKSNDQVIEDIREDFVAYQSIIDDTWSHRHDSCNELTDALDEQCSILIKERDTLEADLYTLHHKNNILAMERDNLQEQFNKSIKAHKTELEDIDTSKCKGSSRCTLRVVHLERALRISRTAEARAIQLVDQVNHDRMVA
ncbi:hypothetical protein E8E12_004113 [Didymella heteroderae]|uniref:Uncharacterized protein n=1 Tax=Didymella heteroderae TaxID=1769908 RepID=A0A9P5BZW2_9PLEO|nr:hypothetical protein E8E12_004113 [Didymella heteroderae]